MEVKLGKLIGMQASPLGDVPTESMDVWRVDVFDDALDNGMLHIGTIGRQDGANFCANHSFDRFTTEQKETIVASIKAQHGSASIAPPVELPEIVEQELDDEDPDDELEDDDDEPDDTETE